MKGFSRSKKILIAVVVCLIAIGSIAVWKQQTSEIDELLDSKYFCVGDGVNIPQQAFDRQLEKKLSYYNGQEDKVNEVVLYNLYRGIKSDLLTDFFERKILLKQGVEPSMLKPREVALARLIQEHPELFIDENQDYTEETAGAQNDLARAGQWLTAETERSIALYDYECDSFKDSMDE